MEGHDLLARLDKVKAPGDFEVRVLARIEGERRRLRVQRTRLRFAFAGTAAAVLAGFVMVNTFVLHKPAPSQLSVAGKQAPATPAGFVPVSAEPSPSNLVPVMERLDYSSELRNVSYEPQTVYILEQVSEGAPSGVKF